MNIKPVKHMLLASLIGIAACSSLYAQKFEELAQTPGMGHRRVDLTSFAILFWPVGAYLILYRVRDEWI